MRVNSMVPAVESLQDRLRDRMLAAVADELTEDEVERFDRGRLLDAIDSAGDQRALGAVLVAPPIC